MPRRPHRILHRVAALCLEIGGVIAILVAVWLAVSPYLALALLGGVLIAAATVWERVL